RSFRRWAPAHCRPGSEDYLDRRLQDQLMVCSARDWVWAPGKDLAGDSAPGVAPAKSHRLLLQDDHRRHRRRVRRRRHHLVLLVALRTRRWARPTALVPWRLLLLPCACVSPG